MTLDPITLTQQLVRIPSVTDAPNFEVSTAMRSLLSDLGFDVVEHPYVDAHGLDKIAISACRQPTSQSSDQSNSPPRGPGVGYFCHNDVVSVEGWECSAGGAFEANITDGKIWGRGTCDMKGSAATALAAISRIDQASQTAPLYFFVTGDEESGMVGAEVLASQSEQFKQLASQGGLGIIGEPTQLKPVLSHKGACHVKISAHGVAAHSSTRDGKNANWQLIPMLAELKQINDRCETDPTLQNDLFDPPTLTMNIVVENAPQMANITVGTATASVFFRPMPDTAWESVATQIMEAATKHDLQAKRFRSLPPLHTEANRPQIQTFLHTVGSTDVQAVCYATDGCCFSAMEDLVVFGPGHIEQAHRADEWVSLDALRLGTDAFERIFRAFATQ
ncbi:MAG: M20 family metallopeptidase [Aureliella sp.]